MQAEQLREFYETRRKTFQATLDETNTKINFLSNFRLVIAVLFVFAFPLVFLLKKGHSEGVEIAGE